MLHEGPFSEMRLKVITSLWPVAFAIFFPGPQRHTIRVEVP